MSTNKTKNLGLHSWELPDPFKMEEFNENFDKIDKAVTEKAEIVTGSYDGDGTAMREIELGFTPKAVYVSSQMGGGLSLVGSIASYEGLALPGRPVMCGNYTAVAITDNGFKVSSLEKYPFFVYTNHIGTGYNYLAVK